MATAAYEMITSRIAIAGKTAIDQYYTVQIASDGTLEKANGTRPVVGIVEYGAASAGDLVTAVRGIYPCILAADATVGARVMPDSANAGKLKTAASTDDACGVLVQGGSAGNTVSVLLLDSAGAAQ